MRRSDTRTLAPRPLRAAGLSFAVAGLALALAAGTAAAATRNVTMNDGFSFSPSSVAISRGDSVRWKNNANFEDHDVFSLGPTGYFKSGGAGGMDPGDRYTRTFPSAGRFPYLCRVHSDDGMDGSVTVPMSAQRVTDGGVKFKLTVATVALSAGSSFRHVIQVDTPGGSSTFVDWKTTTKRQVTYDPSGGGTYRFRALVKRTSDGSRSSASPSVSVTN